MNFTHSVAPRIRTVNCEWNTFVQGDVSCTIELAASVQTICGGVGKALRT